jgi:hypothetical protein
MSVRRRATLTSSVILAVCLGGAIALGRNEARGERVNGDDDPIIVPRWVALADVVDVHAFDPETTGSIGASDARMRHRCDRIAFYPEREPEMRLQEVC